MCRSDVIRLGEDYIRAHADIYYSKFFEEWYVNISENDFHNDPQKNPEKEIPVQFVGLQRGTGMEIYRSGESYFLREVSSRKNFSKWFVCGKSVRRDDGYEARANLIFNCEGQKEKVMYDDWNGVAAYEKTREGEELHNKHFLDNFFKNHKDAKYEYITE